jgi:hypothetical protein
MSTREILAGATACAALILGAGPGFAQDWAGAGLWRGQVGDQPVTACFNDETHGSYYYQKQLRLLTLLAEKDSTGWKEAVDGDRATGTWRTLSVKGDTLTAQWSDPAGHHPLAVKLTRLARTDCSDLAFDGPREKLSPPAAQPVRRIDGREWRPWVVKAPYIADFEISTAELLDAGLPDKAPGIAAINAELRRVLPATDKEKDEFFSCNRQNIATYPQDGSQSITLEPTLWTDDLVGARKVTSWSCGGAHPDFAQRFLLWNARTGKPIDIATWFKDGTVSAADADDAHKTSQPLTDLIAADPRFDGDPCNEAVRETATFGLQPGHQGMIAIPTGVARAVRSCEDEVVIPYDRLTPFLTDAAAAMAARLRTPR